MGVPEEIRRVPRPKNTVVADTGSKGPKRYVVRERAGSKSVPGGNPQPSSGKTIGYIVDGRYCPKEDLPAEKPVAAQPQPLFQDQYLIYGVPALLQPLSQDLLAQLTAVYGPVDAESILAFASLELMNDHISELVGQKSFEESLQMYYEESFFCVYYPHAKLSRRNISYLYKRIHTDTRSRRVWNAVRLNTVQDWEHLVIGKGYWTVRTVNRTDEIASLELQDIMVLYAYTQERMEPLCLQIFPGEEPTDAAYRAFLLDNDIRQGILLTDLDFPADRLQDLLQDRPDLHVILILPDEDPRIAALPIPGEQDPALKCNPDIHFGRHEIPGSRFLYVYQDLSEDEEEEEPSFFSFWTASDEPKEEPPLVIESDLDVPPDDLYGMLLGRMQMKRKLRCHTVPDQFEAAQVPISPYHSGSTFVDFLASILKDRIWQKAAAVKSLQWYSYSGIISALRLVYRQADAPPPTDRNDPYWEQRPAYEYDLLEKLGIIPKTKRNQGWRGKGPSPQT